ncbi:MAG: hypothetical protein MZW92_16985 [Comamonadaceae bacterium]|nr:hypothetical protein [Comamonadaceae bacterium]
MILRDVVRIAGSRGPLRRGQAGRRGDRPCGAADMMSDILALCRPGQLVLTGYIYPQVVRTALGLGTAGAGGCARQVRPPGDRRVRPRRTISSLMRTNIFMFTACGKLREAGLKGVDER